VLRISLPPGENPSADQTTTVDVLQTTFNASKQITAPTESAATNEAGTDPQITGVVFPGQGVTVLPTDTWPKPIEAFDGTKPPVSPEPQEYFVVLQSDSDAVLGLMSFIIVLSADPTLAQGDGSAGGADGTGASAPSGLAGVFGALGEEGGASQEGDAAAGLAALFALAALAGFGDQAVGPTIALVNDTGASDSDGITRDGRLDATAAPDARLQYSSDNGRTWKSSYRPRDGKNSVQVRSIDGSGVESAPTTFVFTLDRRAPAKPTVALALDSGRSSRDGLTNVPDLTIGRREEGATLEYSVNGGGWTQSYAPVEGRNVVRVRQIDVAGNTSRPSRPIRFRLDTEAASVSVAAPAASSRTNAAPRLVGLERGAVVQYSIDGGMSWSRRRPPSTDRGSAIARQVDSAGNQSATISIES
jgi:hypothetical protein